MKRASGRFLRHAGMLALAVFLPFCAAAAESHILEIEGSWQWADIKVQKLIQDGDTLTLVFRGENAALTVADFGPSEKAEAVGNRTSLNLASLTFSGDGALYLSDGVTLTADQIYTGLDCGRLTVNPQALNSIWATQPVQFLEGQVLEVDTQGKDASFEGTLDMAAKSAVRKIGAGTLTLAKADAVYTGRLIAEKGMLSVASSVANRYPGGIYVAPGATFANGASGSFADGTLGDVSVYGTLQMGSTTWSASGNPRVTLGAAATVDTTGPCFRATSGTFTLHVGKQGVGEAEAVWPYLLQADGAATFDVDVDKNLLLTMPPPQVAQGVNTEQVSLTKSGNGRWRAGTKNDAGIFTGVQFAHTGPTVVGGGLYVFGNEVNSQITVKAGACVGGTGKLYKDLLFENVSKTTDPREGPGIDWREGKLRFYINEWGLFFGGRAPQFHANSKFVIIDAKQPETTVSGGVTVLKDTELVEGQTYYGAEGLFGSIDETVKSIELVFKTPQATYAGTYSLARSSFFTGRDYRVRMVGNNVETIVPLDVIAKVDANDATPVDLFTALTNPVPEKNQDLTLDYVPREGAKEGCFSFDNQQPFPMKTLRILGDPGIVDADESCGGISYTELEAEATFGVTPGVLNKITAPSEFVIPRNPNIRAVTLYTGVQPLTKSVIGDRADGMTEQLNICPRETADAGGTGPDNRTLTLNASLGSLVNTTVRSGAVLAFGENARVSGPMQIDMGGALSVRGPASARGGHIDAPLRFFDGAVFEVPTGGGTVPMVTAGYRVTMPYMMRVNLPTETMTFPLDLLTVGSPDMFVGIPPESMHVNVYVNGVGQKDLYDFRMAGNTLQLMKRDSIADSVVRELNGLETWYDRRTASWKNTADARDTYHVPPQNVIATLLDIGETTGISVNVNALVRTLTFTRPTTLSVPLSAPLMVASSAKDDAGNPCMITLVGDQDAPDSPWLTIDTAVAVAADGLRFAKGENGISSGTALVTSKGCLSGDARYPHLTFKPGALLDVSDGRIPSVSESLTLPEGKDSSWSIRLKVKGFGETKVMSILPTAPVNGLDANASSNVSLNAHIIPVNANGEEITGPLREDYFVRRKADGLYVSRIKGVEVYRRTLTYNEGANAFSWSETGAWQQVDAVGNPIENTNPVDAPPAAAPGSNVYAELILDNHVSNADLATLTLNGVSGPLTGLHVRSTFGSPKLRVVPSGTGSQSLTVEKESRLECKNPAEAFDLRLEPNTFRLKELVVEAGVRLTVSEDAGTDGSVFVPYAGENVDYNRGTIVFDAPQKELAFTPPARVGNISITSGTSVRLAPSVNVLQMNVRRDDAGRPGDGTPEAVLRIDSSDTAMLTANKFPADRVRVEQSGPLGRAEYDWETSVLSVAAGKTASWRPTSVLNFGGLVGEGTLNLASTIPTLTPVCDCIFAGQIDSQSAVNGATEVEELLLRPSPTSGNTPDRLQPKQVFSNPSVMPAGASLPLAVEGAHAELNGTWRGDVTVRRYADSVTGDHYAGELGGIGTIEGGLSLYVGTVLDVPQGGALTVNGPLSLPKYNEPLVFRLPDKLEVPFPVIYTERKNLAEDALMPGNLPQVIAINSKSEVIPGAVSMTYATQNGKSGLWLTFTSYAEMTDGETKNWHGYFEDNADTGAVRWTGQNRVHTVGAPNSTTVNAAVAVSGNATMTLNNAASVDGLYIIGKGTAAEGGLPNLTLESTGGNALKALKTKIGVNPEDPDALPDPAHAAGLTIASGAVSSLGPVSVVNGRLTLASGSSLSDAVTVGPQGILAADGATLSGAVTLDEGATVDAQGVDVCPTLSGTLNLPTQLNIIVPSDRDVSATNPISFNLFEMSTAPANPKATTVTLVDATGQPVPGLSNVYSLEHDGTYLVATSEPLWFRELNENGGWSKANQWVNIEKKKPRSTPTNGSTAILTVVVDSTLTINASSTLKRLNIAGPNAVTFKQGTNTSRQIASGVSQIETSVTVNEGADIDLGAVSIANGGSLKMPATAACTSAEVQAGGVLHGGTTVSGAITLHDGAIITIDNVNAPLTADGGLIFDSPAGMLNVYVPAGVTAETTLIAASEVNPAAAPAVTLTGADNSLLVACWEETGLVVKNFGSVFPLPNGKTVAEDASSYSEVALMLFKELTGGTIPTQVIATTQGGRRLLSAAEAAAAVDCFTNVAHWDPASGVLSILYEFGITRATYVTATHLQGRAAVVNTTPSGKTAQIRQGVTLAFYINEARAPEAQATLNAETTDGTHTLEWEHLLDGTPGAARITVKAFPPGYVPATP